MSRLNLLKRIFHLFLHFPQTVLAVDNCFAVADASAEWTLNYDMDCGVSSITCDIWTRTVPAIADCAEASPPCIIPIVWPCTFDCTNPVTTQNCDCNVSSNVSTEWIEYRIGGNCSDIGDCFCNGCEDDNPPYNIARYETDSAACP